MYRFYNGREKMTTLLSIGVAMIAGLLVSRITRRFKLPAVTSYLVAGVLIGPYLIGALKIDGIGFTSSEQLAGLEIISNAALGFIAFSIGNEFRLKSLKETGKQATVIGILQALAATLAVDIALIALHFIMPDKLSLPAAITLGAVAAATAPAATLMVVRQYKAKGKLTSLLLPIVALDDAVGLVIFAVSFGIAKAMVSGSVDIISIVVEPLIEIVASLGLGALMGMILTFIERIFHSGSKRLALCIAFVLITAGISLLKFQIGSVHVGFSSLLACMMLGTIFCNMCDFSEELMGRTDGWTSPLFVLFFVICGAELDLKVFADPAIILIGVVYILARAVGKYFGSYGSSKLMKCDDTVTKNLGITLLPQAGVALGMSVTAMQLGGTDGTLIRNIILFSVLVLELIGPTLTKNALVRAGDVIPENAVSSRRRNTDDDEDDD